MSFSRHILSNSENRLVYLAGGLFIITGILGIIYDFYAIAFLPFAIGMAFLAFYKPAFYVLLICFAVPLSVFIKDIGAGFGISLPTEPMIWIIFILYAFRQIIGGRIDKKFISMPLVAFILINTGWMVITAFTSSMLEVSLKYMLARLWFTGIFFFFMFRIFEDRNYIRRFFTYMLYGTMLVVSITLLKHASEGFSRGWGYGIMKPFFSDHTIYSAYISFFVPVAFMFFLRGNWFHLGFLHRWVFLFIGLVLLIGIVFSYTRASWISLIAALCFYGLIKLRVKFRHLMISLGLLISIGILKQDQILYNLESNKQGSADDLESHAQSVSNITTDPSNLERLNRWHCAVLMFRDKPVFGFGPGTYTFQYAPYQRPENLTLISTHSGNLGNTHSEYLNALSEMGILGFISWLGVFLASIYTGLQVIYDEQKEAWKRSLATATLLGLITYYVHAFLNNFSDFDKIAIPLWGFMAVLAALRYYDNKHENNNESFKS